MQIFRHFLDSPKFCLLSIVIGSLITIYPSNFDESNGPVVYSEIRKKPSKESKESKENKEDATGEVAEPHDEIQTTSTDQAEMPPPPVPPKPRSASAMADPVVPELPERRGVLPAQVRPLVQRPPSPREAGRATPSIEPDLVGKDRYDKASKCFSYAPTKALNEAFERPRKGSVTKVERREEEIQNIDPNEVSNAYIPHSEPARMPVQPKWDDEVESAKQLSGRASALQGVACRRPITKANLMKCSFMAALLDELARIPARSQSVNAQPYYMRNDEAEERPVVVEQAQRATPTPTSTIGGGYRRRKRETKYGSYRTLNDDAYNDMDDLCDPDFYLNYTQPQSTPMNKTTAPKPPERAVPVPEPRIHAGTRSVQLPRKKYQPVEAFTDPLDDILASTAPAAAASCVDLRDRDSHRARNCRSIAALTGPTKTYAERRDSPYFRDRRLFAEDYDAVSEARDADDWLTHKLRKVKSKRDIDPDQMRRRNQEKMLLEELKNATHDNDVTREVREAEFTVEGVGTRDPLAEYRREEERLKNTHSPFEDMPRRGRIRSKPPTPPPRERSRSPARSERATPSIDSYSSYRNHNGVHEPSAHDFSNLGSIVHGNASYSSKSEQNIPNGQLSTVGRRDSRGMSHYEPRSESRPTLQRRQSFGTDRPPFQYADATIQRNNNEPTKFYSGQERVAAAIYRAETPQRELYASGTIHRAETPNRYYPENSAFSQRSETPAFPIMRETPLPFHPLLYAQNGTSRQDLDTTNTLNYRSASPRSQYAGQLSRRSSLVSVVLLTTFFLLVALSSLELISPGEGGSFDTRARSLGRGVVASFTRPTRICRRRLAPLQFRSRRRCARRFAPHMACQAGPSEAVVLRLKSRDISDVSLASSESSGCSSERSSILRSPVNLEETPVLHGTESSVSTDLPKPEVASKESKASDAGTSSPAAVLPPPHLPKQNNTSEIIHHHPVFVKDTSKYWYKPTISREQAINMLRDKAPGTFVVRDSNSFPGAFGLALKVATPPPGVAPGDGTELVRHFLIEPSPKGVKLKGCNNEPVFGSLSALVYQHSITPLALPTKLLLPEYDPATTPEHVSATQALLEQGAACNVAYIGSLDCESLTGSECVRRAVARTVEDTQRGLSRPVSVHFKVSSQGVTLTDNTRKVFFRRHFPVNTVIFAGMDPADRKFDNYSVIGFHDQCVKSARLFAIVARKPSSMENACHVFAEFEPEQPATAVVNFINKVLFANRRS
ncbi:hypothetical protein Y032_0561g3477 [Ancylostoma ceylanicum]|uniref:SH2 domain-containing protein n=1 Tax=Ancylostoma ceylanicum TaxID=53326 RepID=A0A016WPA3_9BILA|nr:hypothetical protein Y032_0561g3477 [Ancylostoma ceylanicum]